MKLPPAVIVHGLAQARAAVSPGYSVTLLSAPGAALYAGCGWWRALVTEVRQAAPAVATQVRQAAPALVAEVRQTAPGATIADVLDCGDAPGRVLEALRCGQRLLVFAPDSPSFGDLAGRVAACGGRLLPAPPPALDLARADAARLLIAWLSGAGELP